MSDFRASLKAVEAAIQARQWNKAVVILEDIQESTRDPQSTAKYFRRIAGHYANTGEYEVRHGALCDRTSPENIPGSSCI